MTKRTYPYNHSKSARIDIRTSVSYKHKIKDKAALCNMSMSDFLVHVGLDRELPQLPNKVSRDFINQLSRIGNNLNQLTRLSHLLMQHLSKLSNDDLLESLDELNELLTDILEETQALRASRL